MNVDIKCAQCDAQYGPDDEDGWEFVNVPYNKMTRDIIQGHGLMYGHDVIVRIHR